MTLKEYALMLRPILEKAMQSVGKEEALKAKTMFPEWKPDVEYEVGYRVQHNNVLYEVLQSHTSQVDWTPDAAPSLFAEVLIPDENVIEDWKKPNSTNGYKKGDKVLFNGKVYESLIDNNIWSLEEHPAGWREVI